MSQMSASLLRDNREVYFSRFFLFTHLFKFGFAQKILLQGLSEALTENPELSSFMIFSLVLQFFYIFGRSST